MGEPVGNQYTAGDTCEWCWGPGKIFGDVFTPKYLYLTWAGLAPPFDVGNKKFIVTQDEDLPCIWTGWDENVFVYWLHTDFLTEAYIAMLPGEIPWFTAVGALCVEIVAFAGASCIIS